MWNEFRVWLYRHRIVAAMAATLAVAVVMIVSLTVCSDDDPPPTTTIPPTTVPITTSLSPTTSSSTTTTTTVVDASRITSPANGEMIQRETTLVGTVAGIPAGHEVWIVVQIGRHYPQDGPLNVLPDGRWTATAFVGGENDAGRNMLLHLVETGPEGSAQFSAYLEHGRNTTEFPGIPQDALAPDVRFLDSVTVTRG